MSMFSNTFQTLCLSSNVFNEKLFTRISKASTLWSTVILPIVQTLLHRIHSRITKAYAPVASDLRRRRTGPATSGSTSDNSIVNFAGESPSREFAARKATRTRVWSPATYSARFCFLLLSVCRPASTCPEITLVLHVTRHFFLRHVRIYPAIKHRMDARGILCHEVASMFSLRRTCITD